MNDERRQQIIADATGKGNILGTVEDAFREAAGRDPSVSAAAEKAEYFASIPGRRSRGVEKQRIAREIDDEHTAAHRADMETALGLLNYSHAEELPVLEDYVRECEQPPSAAEEYERAVPDRGSPDRPLQLALLEQVTRTGIRAELAHMGPAAALELYRGAIRGNGITPDAVVRRAVLIQEIERRTTWDYDPKAPDAGTQHAALLELQKLTASTKADRVPRKLREVLDAAREARRFADHQRIARKLQPATPEQVFGDSSIDARYTDHPAIRRALKRRGGRE